MTDEEKAIAWCEDLIVQSKEIMPQCSDALKAELAEQMEFAETALSTLRDRIARQNPRPLTLDELREMDGEAVYLVDMEPVEYGWEDGYYLVDTDEDVAFNGIRKFNLKLCAGFAYRTKPEPPEQEADYGQ